MTTTDLTVSGRLLALTEQVSVAPGGLSAEVAGETYDEDNPAALARTLGSVFYQTIHAGWTKPMEMGLRNYRDPRYEVQLGEATPQLRLRREAPVVRADGAELLVVVDGVRLRVPRDEASLAPGEESAAFSLPSQRPGLSPGFYYMVGSRTTKLSGPVLRLYARVEDPESAVPVWGAAVALLESLEVPWHAKILSAKLLYPRNDALVIYLQRDGWRHARRIAEHLQAGGRLSMGGSPFTKAITESVSCAFEPSDTRPTFRGWSFGEHRANILAQALVTHASQPESEGQPLSESIHAAALDADIDPTEPARNLTSPATDVLGLY